MGVSLRRDGMSRVCHFRVAKWIYVIGFVMGNEGRNNCHWLGLVHSWGREDHIDTHVDQGFARVSLRGAGFNGYCLTTVLISISMTLKFHLVL